MIYLSCSSNYTMSILLCASQFKKISLTTRALVLIYVCELVRVTLVCNKLCVRIKRWWTAIQYRCDFCFDSFAITIIFSLFVNSLIVGEPSPTTMVSKFGFFFSLSGNSIFNINVTDIRRQHSNFYRRQWNSTQKWRHIFFYHSVENCWKFTSKKKEPTHSHTHIYSFVCQQQNSKLKKKKNIFRTTTQHTTWMHSYCDINK